MNDEGKSSSGVFPYPHPYGTPWGKALWDRRGSNGKGYKPMALLGLLV
jgi:hypothetical protein